MIFLFSKKLQIFLESIWVVLKNKTNQ